MAHTPPRPRLPFLLRAAAAVLLVAREKFHTVPLKLAHLTPPPPSLYLTRLDHEAHVLTVTLKPITTLLIAVARLTDAVWFRAAAA